MGHGIVNNTRGPSPLALSRRLLIAATFALGVLSASWPAVGQDIDVNAILHDPDAPVGGNPNGDVTIVAFLDYNCPFCKKATPELDRLVKTDGKIRLVYKDWPILSETSVAGAELALAAKYQDKYDIAHSALMAIHGTKIPEDRMRDALKTAGIDMTRLDTDLVAHQADIKALLKRNLAQADALGLKGTPVFLVGPFKVAAALDYKGFQKVVASARDRQR
jgi:protein-disulfide isomerase